MRGLAALSFLVGCYSPPPEAACSLTCTAEIGCPSHLQCNGGMCTLPSGTCSEPELDARVDVPPDGAAAVCYGDSNGTGLLKLCFESTPSNTVSFPLGTTVIETTALAGCVRHDDGVVDVCVVSAGRLVIPSGATVRAVGTRPLVLAADQIEISGTLDAAAHRDGMLPAGSRRDGFTCGLGGTIGGGGSGGAGGSFVGSGGPGGAQNGGIASTPRSTQAPDRLHGGCDGMAAAQGGGGGLGGGAVYLAANSITVTSSGVINVSGGGGAGSVTGGGGGGGSGGLVGFDAPAGNLQVAGFVLANGGGGGCGGTAVDGADPNPGMPSQGAAGGCMGAGTGGSGSAGTMLDGNGGVEGLVGGGGGGGGAGVIRTFANTIAASPIVSPPAQP